MGDGALVTLVGVCGGGVVCGGVGWGEGGADGAHGWRRHGAIRGEMGREGMAGAEAGRVRAGGRATRGLGRGRR